VKISAVFLLSGFFLLLPAVGVVPLYAQTLSQMKDCGFAPALATFTVERRVRVESGPPLEIVSPQIVGYLEDGQNCLNDNQMSLKASVKDLQFLLISNDDFETDILDLRDKLKQAKVDLDAAKADLEMKLDRTEVDLRIAKANIEILQQEVLLLAGPSARRPPSKPKAAASKPKAPVNEPKPAVDSSKNQ